MIGCGRAATRDRAPHSVSLFVTFEGIEGSGKSTHLRGSPRALRTAGHDVVETREPGGTALGQALRELLLAPSATPPRAARRAAPLLRRPRAARRAGDPARARRRAGSCSATASPTRPSPTRATAAASISSSVRALDARGARRARAGPDLPPRLPARCRPGAGAQRARARRSVRAGGARLPRGRARGFHALAAAAPGRYRVIDSTPPAAEVARARSARRRCAPLEATRCVTLADVVGHDAAIARLRRAAADDRPATGLSLRRDPPASASAPSPTRSRRSCCARRRGPTAPAARARSACASPAGRIPTCASSSREDDRRDIRTEQIARPDSLARRCARSWRGARSPSSTAPTRSTSTARTRC